MGGWVWLLGWQLETCLACQVAPAKGCSQCTAPPAATTYQGNGGTTAHNIVQPLRIKRPAAARQGNHHSAAMLHTYGKQHGAMMGPRRMGARRPVCTHLPMSTGRQDPHTKHTPQHSQQAMPCCARTMQKPLLACATPLPSQTSPGMAACRAGCSLGTVLLCPARHHATKAPKSACAGQTPRLGRQSHTCSATVTACLAQQHVLCQGCMGTWKRLSTAHSHGTCSKVAAHGHTPLAHGCIARPCQRRWQHSPVGNAAPSALLRPLMQACKQCTRATGMEKTFQDGFSRQQCSWEPSNSRAPRAHTLPRQAWQGVKHSVEGRQQHSGAAGGSMGTCLPATAGG
jgi:hypothetical protein